MGWGGVMKVPEQIIATTFNKLYDREILLVRDQKEINEAKKQQKLDLKDRDWFRDPQRLQPVVYSLNKKVSQFSEFEKKLLDQHPRK